jgi:hypothetical protein
MNHEVHARRILSVGASDTPTWIDANANAQLAVAEAEVKDHQPIHLAG